MAYPMRLILPKNYGIAKNLKTKLQTIFLPFED